MREEIKRAPARAGAKACVSIRFESGPLIRTIAMPPLPGGVAIAAMVVFGSCIVCKTVLEISF
jgi:hypothetical protein